MSTPFAIRTTRRASRRTTSTWRGSRSNSAAKSTASWRGSNAGQVDDRALRLRDDLLGDHEDVVEAERERARRALDRVADQRPRSSPRRTSGMPSSERTVMGPGSVRAAAPGEPAVSADGAAEAAADRPRRPRSAVGGACQRTPIASGTADSMNSRSSGVSRSIASGPPTSR